MAIKRTILLLTLSLSITSLSFSQLTSNESAGIVNAFTPAVPFLKLPTLAVNQGIGYIRMVGQHSKASGHIGNPAIMAMSDNKMSFAAGYTPWIRELLPDVNLAGVAGYFEISPGHYVGVDFTHFSLGQITANQQNFKPNEWVAAINYSQLITDNSSVGVRIKYVRSNLTGGRQVGGMESIPGRSIATDIGYSLLVPGKNESLTHELGIGINNLGTKISYQENSDKDFIPTTLNAGYSILYQITPNQNIFLAYEAEKYLIPTPPFYHQDSVDINGDPVILAGYDPDVSVFKGMIRSFYDAPDGMTEEMNEIIHHIGMVYSFRNFSLHSGLFLEHVLKGNSKFATLGLGISFRNFVLNISYLIPFYQNSPLANTVGVSLVWVG